jgi:hypothetical protein
MWTPKFFVILLVVVLMGTTSIKAFADEGTPSSANSLAVERARHINAMTPYLFKYWGSKDYASNFAAAFDGHHIAFVSTKWMQNELVVACKKDRRFCVENPGSVRGINLHNGRIILVVPDGMDDSATGFYLAAHLLHELRHDGETADTDLGKREVACMATFTSFVEKLFGDVWLTKTMASLQMNSKQMQLKDGTTYFVPMTPSAAVLSSLLAENGIVIDPKSSKNREMLLEMSFVISNDPKVLEFPAIARNFTH